MNFIITPPVVQFIRMKVNNNITRLISTLLGAAFIATALCSCALPGTGDSETIPTSDTVPVTLQTMETTVETIEETTAPTETEFQTEIITSDFINTMYTELLGRSPTDAELETYLGPIDDGDISVVQFINDILNSEEFESLEYSDEIFINICFRTFMRSIPDTEIQTYWINLLENDYTRIDVANQIMRSQEFLEMCSGYGLLPESNYAPEWSDIEEELASVVGGEYIVGIGGYVPSTYALTELNNAIADLNSHRYSFGFVLIDMQTGLGICYNLDQDFYTASSIKGPFATSLAYYNSEAASRWEGTISSMLVYSDNDAYTALNDSYHRTYIQQWCEECGVDPAKCVYKYPHLTSRDMALMWAHSYYYFEEDEFGATVGTWFESPVYSLIHSELGEMYVTRSKAGWVADDNPAHTTTVDAGIVYADNGPYVVAIMSRIPSTIEPLRPLMQALNNVHNEM